MKKFIVLSTAVIMLLFGFAVAVTEVSVANEKITVCEDIKPRGNPRDFS